MSEREREAPDPGHADDGIETGADDDGAPGEDVPVWDDDYLERVSGRLLHNYDLERDRTAAGEHFDLYGEMRMRSQKHFLHPALSYAEHRATEHLFAKRVDGAGVADVERYVDLGHDLAEEWIEADEEHYGTDFSFVLVVPRITDDVREFVTGFKARTMIRYGYHGHYEINLVVVAPDAEEIVTSRSTDLDRAFAVWSSADEAGDDSPGLLDRLF